MVRPLKNSADYFPHDADLRNDRRIQAVRRKYGLEGYAVYSMMLETLTDCPGFRWQWTSLELELLAGDFGMDSDRLGEILTYMVELGLYKREGQYLWSDPLLARFAGLLEKRQRQRKSKASAKTPENEVIDDDNPETETETGLSSDKNFCPGVIDDENTQSKVKQSKPNQSKEEKTKANQSKANSASSDERDANCGEDAATEAPGGTSAASCRTDPGTPPESQGAAMPGTPVSEPDSQGPEGPPDPAWLRRRELLFRELSTVLKLDPLATDGAGQDSYIRASRAILKVLDKVRGDAELKSKRWDEIEKRLRKFAAEARRDGKNPVGLWLHKCRQEWPVPEDGQNL